MEKTIRELQAEAYQTAVNKGWHDVPRSAGEAMLLMHSEISEACEEYRRGRPVNEVYTLLGSEQVPGGPQKPEGVPTELADCVIRIMDFCGEHGIDLQAVIEQKMEFNRSRPYRHGNKVV